MGGTTVPVPNGVTETPDDTSYCLTMFDTLGGPEQKIEITRDELILRPLSRKTRIPCQRGERGLGMLFGDAMTVADVAERLKMSRSWVLTHSSGNKRPQIPCIRQGRSVRFRSADVETFILDFLRLSGRRLRGYKTPPES